MVRSTYYQLHLIHKLSHYLVLASLATLVHVSRTTTHSMWGCHWIQPRNYNWSKAKQPEYCQGLATENICCQFWNNYIGCLFPSSIHIAGYDLKPFTTFDPHIWKTIFFDLSLCANYAHQVAISWLSHHLQWPLWHWQKPGLFSLQLWILGWAPPKNKVVLFTEKKMARKTLSVRGDSEPTYVTAIFLPAGHISGPASKQTKIVKEIP